MTLLERINQQTGGAVAPAPAVAPVVPPVAMGMAPPTMPTVPVAAPVTPPVGLPVAVPVPAPAIVPPAPTPPAAPTVTTAHQLAAAMPAPAPALGGGNRLGSVMDALKSASVGNRRNDLPVGTGTFLLKSGKFTITDGGKYRITTFSLLCLQGIVDGNGIQYGSQGYSGPMAGEVYETPIFQDMSPAAQSRTMSQNISVLRACLGWTAELVKQYQATDEGARILLSLLSGIACVDLATLTPTNQPCICSNQAVVQITTKVSIVPVKDKISKQPTYDANQQPITRSYSNTYWDNKVTIPDIIGVIGEEACIKAFGSQELVLAAAQHEAAVLAAM